MFVNGWSIIGKNSTEPNLAPNLAPFGSWMLCNKAAQRRVGTLGIGHRSPMLGLPVIEIGFCCTTTDHI